MPDHHLDAVVIRYLLERNASERPDEDFVHFEDGSIWTRRQALETAYAAANVLRAKGVTQGDRVAVFLPNGPDMLRAWWGIAALGAAMVPINLSYRGGLLQHLISLSKPMLIIVDTAHEAQILTAGNAGALVRLSSQDLIAEDSSAPELERSIEPWGAHLLLMTSGTTGPSKLAEISYRSAFLGGSYFSGSWGATNEDLMLVDLPLFHGGALYQVSAGIAARVRFAVRSAPNLNAYWDVARETGATLGFLLSSMVPFLQSRPASAADTDHRLRALITAPLPADIESFTERFGIPEIVTALGSTEAPGIVCRAPGQPLVPGYCGRLREGFEVRLVDEHDHEVPVGEVGEAIVRTDLPWMLMSGYVGNPEAQARVTRNGWFHTGDLLRRDEEGNYFFVDRNKDSLRRRGENVSSFEVEAEVMAFPGVAEAACVAYRDPDLADDEVKVWVVAEPGAEVDLEQLFLSCVERMPHFMVPSYLEVIDELPKTPTARVQKYLLRERGNSERTWSPQTAGYRLTRNGLVRTEPTLVDPVVARP